MTATSGPQRTCIGCRRTGDARDLLRLVRAADGSLTVGRRLQGRGAWMCAGSPSCFDLAVKRDAFRRAFRAPVDRKGLIGVRSEVVGGPG